MLTNILLRRNSCGNMTSRELEFRRSFEPPQPAQGSGDGRCDGDVRTLREPSSAPAAEEHQGQSPQHI